ncbi:MAG: SDR family NAD(P)-dependent oxidoreductase, partial [Actinobacteria bacterium]|nr:SDR family NAD(P)-dependent oxidoreductase [Actinomycetota bacterium]
MKLAFVSGGSRGLGKEVAKALAIQGHRVVIIGKDENRASATANELGCEFECADLEIQTQARTLAETMLAKY